MYTLYDFITHVKGVEYVIAILFIAGFVLYLEALKPMPFRTLVNAARETRDYMKSMGCANMIRTVGKIVAAPFIGLAYIVALPFVFASALVSVLASKASLAAARGVSFGWRPMEAYLAGKKKNRNKNSGTS